MTAEAEVLQCRRLQQCCKRLEDLTYQQLSITQAKSRKTCGIQRMLDLTRMLQDQHPSTAI